ncbi:MAG: hypothetical protein ACTSW1_04255 [Candidatus Hodarchaeales archaeon]
MRKTVIKLSRILLTISGIGIAIISLSILYFSGLASPDRLFYGFNYQSLLAFGFYLSFIGLIPVLTSLDDNMKNNIKKIYGHLLLLTAIGAIGVLYSLLVYGNYLAAFDAGHSWFDYFIISSLIVFLAFTPLLFSVKNRERLWNYKYLYMIFLVVGSICILLSSLIYGQFLDLGTILPMLDVDWYVIFFVGIIFAYFGILPLVISGSEEFREFMHRFRFLWVIGILAGLLLITMSLMGVLYDFTIQNIEWPVFLVFGTLILFTSSIFLVSSEEISSTIKKLKFLWFFVLLIGIVITIISFILVLSTSAFTANIFVIDQLMDMNWQMYNTYGLIMTVFALIFIGSILFYESEDVGAIGLSDSASNLFNIEARPSEMVTILEIVLESNDKLINKFKEAVREDKFRPRVYETLVKQYQNQNQAIKARLEKSKKKVSAAGVESLFVEALGEKPSEATTTSAKAPSIPSKGVTPPPAPPVGSPPSPPPTTASAPPVAPPVSGLPPKSPPTSTGAPPSVPTTPSTGKEQSPLDLIADARSTSIAELRGEMLKELRRLREIFKEE